MAKRSHFRIAGIPVRVEVYFFVIIGILAYEFNILNPKPSYIVALRGHRLRVGRWCTSWATPWPSGPSGSTRTSPWWAWAG